MGEASVLTTLVLILGVALVVVAVSQRLKVMSVVGFMLTGVLLGPTGIGLVKNDATITLLADIGVIMLLFVIGLEFSLKKIMEIRKDFLLGGILQVGLTTAAAALLLVWLGLGLPEALAVGFIISNNSMAVLIKVLAERGETDAPHGRSVLALSLFNDLAAIPMIALIPLLRGGQGGIEAIALKFGGSIAGIAAAFIVFRFLVPRALDWVMGTRVKELFILASLFTCLGLALVSSALGLSMALGAFLAGLIVADSPYAHQSAADILPFRDVFISLFFVSIGLLLDIRVLSGMIWVAAAMAAGVFLLKASVNFLTLMILRRKPRGALIGAIGLAQVGEFSFVLAGVARAQGFLAGPGFQLFLSSAILTMIATPLLLRAADAVTDRLSRSSAKHPVSRSGGGDVSAGMKDHVVIAGYGLNGQNLARVLRTTGIPHLVIDLDPKLIRKAAEDCETCLFGDICRVDILRGAGVEQAKLIVFAISDATATRRGVRTVRFLGSSAQILVRTRYVSEIDELYASGADIVIPEEFETSIEIFSRVLEAYHIPKNVVDAEVKVIRAERYGVLRASGPVRPSMEKIADLLTAGTAETFYIGQDCPAAGLTLAQIDLRARTGATVIAVVRGDDSFTGPSADFKIETGDTLVLVASHAAMDSAFEYLKACAVKETVTR